MSPIHPVDEEELLSEFKKESMKLFSKIESEMETLSSQGGKNEEALRSIFRFLHTIKGTSSFMKMQEVTDLAHRLENAVQEKIDGGGTLDSEAVETLERSCKTLKSMIMDWSSIQSIPEINANRTSGNGEESTNRTLNRFELLRPFFHRKACECSSLARKVRSLPEDSQTLGELSGNVKLIEIMAENCGNNELFRLCYGVINVLDVAGHGQIHWNDEVRLSINEGCEELAKILGKEEVEGTADFSNCSVLVNRLSRTIKNSGKPVSALFKTSYEGEHFTLRIIPDKFDLIYRTLGKIEKFNENYLASLSDKNFEPNRSIGIVKRQKLEISALKEILLETMRIPLMQLFRKFKRIVENSARILEKEIDFDIVGGDLQIDRSLESINNSLVHIIRNSCDHGIELPEARESKGKPRKGKILLEAKSENDLLVIKVIDDGQGLDKDKIKLAAVSKGLATREEVDGMSEKEVFGLIFRPGFTTVEKLSQISGRGVGMDVVIADLKSLKGNVTVESAFGLGTTITLTLPLRPDQEN